jgi:hypothetical protein
LCAVLRDDKDYHTVGTFLYTIRETPPSKHLLVGPVEEKLVEFWAKVGPKPHAVLDFILGAFSELSNSCYSLCTAIARVGAARVVSFWKIPRKHALALCKQKILLF